MIPARRKQFGPEGCFPGTAVDQMLRDQVDSQPLEDEVEMLLKMAPGKEIRWVLAIHLEERMAGELVL